MSTVGEVIAELVHDFAVGNTSQLTSDICAALGVAPDAPVSNLVALTDGQYVVEARELADGDVWLGWAGDRYGPFPAHEYNATALQPRLVVVREAERTAAAIEVTS